MTDQRLRRLEREVAASPSPESEAALLRERLRAGTLSLERLELAAYCGHEAALAIVPRPHGAPSDCGLCHGHPDGILVMHTATSGLPPWSREPCSHELRPWVRGLALWGHKVMTRASVAAARCALPVWCDITRLSRRRGLHTEREAKEGVCTRCTKGDPGFGLPGDAIVAAERWIRSDWSASDHDSYGVGREWDEAWSRCWRQAAWTPAPWASDGARETEITGSAALAGEAPVRAAIQSALISWALGSKG